VLGPTSEAFARQTTRRCPQGLSGCQQVVSPWRQRWKSRNSEPLVRALAALSAPRSFGRCDGLISPNRHRSHGCHTECYAYGAGSTDATA
jgi:hypothetical protein